ncbi:MAG: tyrosine-type recombinase/integrase, partial [Candidatus Paceibacterota bacterium]
KRFIFLGAYLREQKEKGIIQSIHFLNEFMKKEFKGRKGEKKYKTTLTVDEIYKLYNSNIKADYFSRSRDYFVFCCLTGMRFSDFQQIDRTNLYNENGVRLIRKRAHKTRHESAVEFEVPLVEVAYEIFKKYNFKFPTISNQKANAYLEKALKESKMFDTETPLFREDFSDEEETSQFLKRYEIISFHTGRHSFITNLIDTTPIPVLMRYTGHSKIETLMGYVKQRDLQTHYISALELNK